MTIPGDVRDIIQDALYSYRAIARGIQDVTGESSEDVLVAIDAACAWLKGQPRGGDGMSDYDAMTEREAMQLRVLRVAYHLEDACGPNGLLGPYSGDEEQLVRGLLDDLHAVSDWLDAQPAAPEPDWTTAPDWAQWWAVSARGVASWWAGDKPYIDGALWDNGGGKLITYVIDLPLGVDWRMTLRRRPEVTS